MLTIQRCKTAGLRSGKARQQPAVALRGGLRRSSRASSVVVQAASTSDNPLREVLSSVAINVYKLSAMAAQPAANLTPMWQAMAKLDVDSLERALKSGANVNERNPNGDTPLLVCAREGHYKYSPAEIPTALIRNGADMEVMDANGLTALQVSLLAGWQNIAELLIRSGASTQGVAGIKGRITCPDCKRLVAKYNL